MTWAVREGDWSPSDEQRARWVALSLAGLRRGNCILNFHRLSAKQRETALEFFGMMAEQQDCPHWEFKGVDQTPVTDPTKQWRCTQCALIRVGP